MIIPVYNSAETLARCLASVLDSNYRRFECIVVDDHSSDNTVSVAESFNGKIKVLRLDKQEGAAHARNRGAEESSGDILLFVDSDVQIPSDCLGKVAENFKEHPEISALFGSYDDQPASPDFYSQYKNLFHHYIHQTSKNDASTFWTGCGAIRREVFFKIGQFNEHCRMMEDIELGYRLKAQNHTIHLVKDLYVKHLKRYSFLKLLKSDLFDRAIPWTILMLKNKQFTNDLNVKHQHKFSAMLIILMAASLFMALKSIWFVLAIPVLLGIYILINHDFYQFFCTKKGPIFAVSVIPLHFLYYFYSSLGLILGICKYLYNKDLY